MPNSSSQVAIVGGGSIGTGWAIVFAQAGIRVTVVENDADRRAAIPEIIDQREEELRAHGLLGTSTRLRSFLTVTSDLSEGISEADHIQECVPEYLDLKRELFFEIDAGSLPEATIASSSSSMTTSDLADHVSGRHRCLVVHPVNPPDLLRVVEISGAPFTDDEVLDRTVDLMKSVRMTPIALAGEIAGHVFNRIQGAALREAYCLVRDGVVSPSALDTLVTHALGPRWSVIGPFATAELNTRGGIKAHARTLGPAYARMGIDRGLTDPWSDELVETVAADLEERFPSEQWDAHVRWRDRALMIVIQRLSQDGLNATAGDTEYRARPL